MSNSHDFTIHVRLKGEEATTQGLKRQSQQLREVGNTVVEVNARANSSYSATRRGVESISKQLARLQSVATMAGTAMAALSAARGVARMADQWAQVQGKLKLATQGAVSTSDAMQRVYQVAQRTFSEMETTGELVGKLTSSIRGMGRESNVAFSQALGLAETINKTFVISGASATAQSNAILQFTQALDGGVLRAEEFNSVIQNSPRLIQAMADGMGMSMGQLRAEVMSGQVSAERLLKALQSQAAVINEEFEQMPMTIGNAMTQLQNSLLSVLGSVDKFSGASSFAAKVIAGLAEVTQHLGGVILVGAAAGIGYLVAATSRLVVQKMEAAKAARALALAELESAHAAQRAAAGQLAFAKAGMGSLTVAQAQAQLEAATHRVAAATRAASVAMTAKAAAMRAATTAMAAFGGPVGMAVTALTLFVMWAMNSTAKANELAQAVATGFQQAEGSMASFRKETANEAFAGLKDSLEVLEKAQERVQELQREVQSYRKMADESIAKWGGDGGYAAKEHERLSEELARATTQYDALSSAAGHAVKVSADVVLEVAGVTNATQEYREKTEELIRSLGKQGMTLEQSIPNLQRFIDKLYGTEAAARLAAAGVAGFARVISAVDWSSMDQKLEQQSRQAQLRLIEQTQGKAAAMRAQFGFELGDMKAQNAPAEEITKRQAQLEQIIRLEAEYERAVKNSRTAATASRASARSAHDKLKELQRAQADFAAENRRMEAQLAGPVAEAWYEYETGVAEARKALKELRATQEEVQIREQLLMKFRDRKLADIAKEQDVLSKLRAEYEEHLLLADLSNRERRVEDALLRLINDAREKGVALTAEQIQETRAWLQQQEYAIEYAETQVRVAEDVESAWKSTWGNAADAMSDWFARGLRDGKQFFKSLMQMAQRWVAQLASMMMKSRLGDMFGRDFGAGTRSLGLADFIRPASNGAQSAINWRSMLGGGGTSAGGIVQKLAGLFGLSRSGGFANAGWSFGSKQMPGGGGYFGTLTATGIPAMPAGSGGGHFGTLGMLGHSKVSAFAKFAPWAGALLGGLYGLRAGSDAPGKLLGAGAYGALGFGGVAAGSALFAGGGLSGALSAFGPIGWAGLAAVALDKISGGKLFGTKYRVDSSALQIEFGDGGIGGHASSTEVKQRSLFRGRRWRTATHALDDETRKNAERFLTELRNSLGKAAAQLGVDTPTLMAAQFRREFDKNGNLTREFGTIAGRVYSEAQEAFTQRLQAENLLNVAKAAGNGAEIERLAERYRATPEGLAEYAELLMAVQSDVKAAKQLWTDTGEGSLTRVVEAMERLSRGAETLTETYQRVMEATGQYGELMAGIEKELRTSGLNQWQKAVLDVETQYRQQVRQANELAKALGLSGARSEDLAKIELLRARRMAELQRQMEQQRDAALAGLSLSEYSPLTDQQKLAEAMQQFDAAIAAGDINTANQLAQTVLELGRNLYASGADYNALYGRVTDAIRNIAMPALEMDDGTTMGDLAQILLDLPNQFASALYAAATGELPVAIEPPVSSAPIAVAPVTAPAPAPVPPSGGIGGGGGAFDSLQLHGGPGFDIGRPDNGGYQHYLNPALFERIEEHLAALRSDSQANRRDNTADRLHELVMNK